MAIVRRKIKSKEMERVIRFVKQMTKSMPFDENMENFNWVKGRRRNNLFYRLMPKEKNVGFRAVDLAGRKAMVVRTKAMKKRTPLEDAGHVILYLHGGGFVTGNALVCKSYCSMLTKYCQAPVIAVNYGLAPEHKFPDGFEDCCNAFEIITKKCPKAQITLVGESAGGNLSLALALKYKDSGRINCVIVNSPTVDFTGSIDHSINENHDFLVKRGCQEALVRMYVGDQDPSNPYISPICGDFTGFPPIYITCDAHETLYADAIALYDACEKAGVRAELLIAEGGYHAFAASGTNTPETTRILEETASFMRKAASSDYRTR